MIYDIILAAILALFIIIGVRKGAAKSLSGLLVSFVSYVGATFLGKLISVKFYQMVLQPTIYNTVVNNVTSFSSEELNNRINSLEFGWLDFNIGKFNIADGLKDKIGDYVRGQISIDDLATSAGNTTLNVVEPIIVGILTFFITIFLFFILFVLLRKFVVPLLLKVFKLPVIRQLDVALGVVVGIVEAFLVISMLGYLLSQLIPQISTEEYLLQESTINKSFIFKHFYSGNIFSTFASWLKL